MVSSKSPDAVDVRIATPAAVCLLSVDTMHFSAHRNSSWVTNFSAFISYRLFIAAVWHSSLSCSRVRGIVNGGVLSIRSLLTWTGLTAAKLNPGSSFTVEISGDDPVGGDGVASLA